MVVALASIHQALSGVSLHLPYLNYLEECKLNTLLLSLSGNYADCSMQLQLSPLFQEAKEIGDMKILNLFARTPKSFSTIRRARLNL